MGRKKIIIVDEETKESNPVNVFLQKSIKAFLRKNRFCQRIIQKLKNYIKDV